MKKRCIISINTYVILVIVICSSFYCKKEVLEEMGKKSALISNIGINVQKIENMSRTRFAILKTEAIGYTPVHKFYWVCLKEKADHTIVERLAYEIIKETISRRPKTYHSFTIHFFMKDGLAESVEKSERYAQATFLPEGNWLKVGRVPIDNYEGYKLTCTFLK